jgi:predicted small lipoprotein YifL
MNNKRLSRLVFALLLSLPLLTACGQKGDLYLPAASTTYTPHDKA